MNHVTRTTLACALLAAALLARGVPVSAADAAVFVDPAATLSDATRRPIGINMNYYLDHDANRVEAIQSLVQALRQMKVRYLRYPGGGKSQNNRWAGNPARYPAAATDIPGLPGLAAKVWPYGDAAVMRFRWLTFDEFMSVARRVGAEPVVVVNQCGYTVGADKADLVEDARQWVYYANRLKRYRVKYWEIGNEPYHASYVCNGVTAQSYADDVIRWSKAMKEVDPTIRVGAALLSSSWNEIVISETARHIDWVAAHQYPASSGWPEGYRTYLRRTDFGQAVDAAAEAIEKYAAAGDRERLRNQILVTEFGPLTFRTAWPDVNDLGHALFTFDMIGQHVSDPRLIASQLWNTRWVHNDTVTEPSLTDALSRSNALQATGLAVRIWGEILLDRMIASTNPSAVIRTFASAGSATGGLSLAILNKDHVARSIDVVVQSSSFTGPAEQWEFKGTAVTDFSPTWRRVGTARFWSGKTTITASPTSVTVLKIRDVTTPDPEVLRQAA